MKIRAQDGNIYEARNLEMDVCVLKCNDIKDRRKNINLVNTKALIEQGRYFQK